MSGTEKSSLNIRIAAMAFVDVADYTRHMADDNVAAVRSWNHLRDTILIANLKPYSGRLINEAGDAILVEFASATGAVNWALNVQKIMRERPKVKNPMLIRIGINVDDVVDNGENIQSDGVIVAARIHQLAAPGEIVVTQITRDIVRGRVGVSFRDLGAPSLKNIDQPIRIFAVEERKGRAALVRPHASWSSRPTLAVLPFRDQAAVEEDRYFGEGITEDIIEGISRSRAMFVVARNSTLQFSDGKQQPADIARSLGVKYLLTGSIRRQSDQLRIHAELIDVDRSRTIWAERFDGMTKDIFSFQDKIASSIVATLEPKVLRAEASNLGSRPTDSLDAYGCVLRSLPELYSIEVSGYLEARSLLMRAVSLDPGYAQAHAYLAWCLNFIIAEGHSDDVQADKDLAIQHARTAVHLDSEDAFNLSVRGHILGLVEGQPHEAMDILEDALRLNMNLPVAWALSAIGYAYMGDADEARERLRNVWQLTPFDSLNFFFWTAGGLVEFVAADYESAVRLLNRALHAKPNFMAALRLLAAALALTGNITEAREVAAALQKKDPGFSIAEFMAWYPLKSATAREQLILGLGLAGLPATASLPPVNELL